MNVQIYMPKMLEKKMLSYIAPESTLTPLCKSIFTWARSKIEYCYFFWAGAIQSSIWVQKPLCSLLVDVLFWNLQPISHRHCTVSLFLLYCCFHGKILWFYQFRCFQQRPAMLHPQNWISFFLSISSYLCFYIYRTYSKKRLNILGLSFPPWFTGDLKFFVLSSSPDMYNQYRFFLKFRHLWIWSLKSGFKRIKREYVLMRLYVTGNSTRQWCNFLLEVWCNFLNMFDDSYEGNVHQYW